MSVERPLPSLQADCARCSGLCCVAPALIRPADFAIHKPAHRPCPHLRIDSGCDIHDRLREEGFPGCVAYDCAGAGQRITNESFGGRTWRDDPASAPTIFNAFTALWHVHDLLWHLDRARGLVPPDSHLAAEVASGIDLLLDLGELPGAELAELDVSRHAGPLLELLERVSAHARAGVERPGSLRGADLRGADLAGADLAGADLRLADLTGADLHGTVLRGADLSSALFVRQGQLEVAVGDASTRLPAGTTRPRHWPA